MPHQDAPRMAGPRLNIRGKQSGRATADDHLRVDDSFQRSQRLLLDSQPLRHVFLHELRRGQPCVDSC